MLSLCMVKRAYGSMSLYFSEISTADCSPSFANSFSNSAIWMPLNSIFASHSLYGLALGLGQVWSKLIKV